MISSATKARSGASISGCGTPSTGSAALPDRVTSAAEHPTAFAPSVSQVWAAIMHMAASSTPSDSATLRYVSGAGLNFRTSWTVNMRSKYRFSPVRSNGLPWGSGAEFASLNGSSLQSDVAMRREPQNVRASLASVISAPHRRIRQLPHCASLQSCVTHRRQFDCKWHRTWLT
jgi:hypothetical protein